MSLHLLGSHDRLKFTEKDGNEHVDALSTSGYLWLRALRAWSPSVSTESMVSLGRLVRSRRGISEPEIDPIAVDDWRGLSFFGLRHEFSVNISASQLFRGGVEVRPLDAEYRYATVDAGLRTALALDPSGSSYAAYASYRAALNDRFALELGARWDRQTYTAQSQLGPRANAIWRPGAHTEVRLAVGRHFQSQRINELNVSDGQTQFVPAERSDQVDVSVQHRFASGVRFRVDAYGKWLSDVQPRFEHLFHPLQLFPETESDRVEIVPSDARLRGIEITLSSAPGRRLFWWAGYVASSAYDVENGREVPRSWDQPHAGHSLVGYRWDNGWAVSTAATVHTGWPATPVSGEAVTQPDGSVEIEPLLGPRNSSRYSTYARWDVQLSRSIALKRGRLQLRLDVVNLTNRANACCVDEFQFTQQPDGTIDSTPVLNYWLGFTPTFSVGWEF